MKNKLKRAAAMAATGAKRAAAATASGAKRAAAATAAGAKRAAAATASATERAAVAARAKYDKMQEGRKAPATAPTPYVNQNGNRIYKSNKGAVFTKNVEGNRNYTPVAVGIKEPNGKAMPLKVINKNTVPMNMRPNKNNKNLDKTGLFNKEKELMKKNMMFNKEKELMKKNMMFNKEKELMKKNMMFNKEKELMNKNMMLMKKNL